MYDFIKNKVPTGRPTPDLSNKGLEDGRAVSKERAKAMAYKAYDEADEVREKLGEISRGKFTADTFNTVEDEYCSLLTYGNGCWDAARERCTEEDIKNDWMLKRK